MGDKHSQQKRRQGRRGMSLVEILVVLVILVIGIFAITRLFPQGFANLNYTAAKTQANALAKQFEDYLSRNRENLPDGVVAIDRNTGLLRTSLSPGERHHSVQYTDNAINGYAGAPPEDPRFSGANVARRVVGEQFKIPPPSSNYGPGGETVSIYRPLFGPIYSAVPMPPVSLGVSAYSGTPMQRVVCQDPPSQENKEAILNLGVQGYGIDYDAGLLYLLPAPYSRYFKIELSYRGGPGAASQTIPDNSLFVPADPNAFPNPDASGNILITTINLRAGSTAGGVTFVPIPGGARIDPGSDFLYRRFNQILAADPFTSDPYEFKVYDTILGLLGFNPISASIPLPRQEGRGLTARIDYDVDDWEILRQDEVVPLEQVANTASSPGNGFYAIKLASGAIKRFGDVEETVNFVGAGSGSVDTTFEYQGLIRNYPAGTVGSVNVPQRAGTTGIDVIIVDLQTGYTINSSTLQRDGNNLNGEIDYASGQILLKYVPGTSPMWSPPSELAVLGASPVHFAPAGRQVRIFYRTTNDMAVAVVKPYSTYLLQPDLSAIQSRQYYTGYGAGHILFPPSEHEKTVAVDYTWQDTQGRMHVETGELHRIEAPDPPQAPVSPVAPVAGCGGAGGYDPTGFWWVRVSRADVDSCKVNAGVGDAEAYVDPAPVSTPVVEPGSIRILGVRGVSVHTHVTWREATRRRQMERTSILTREQSR